MFAFVVKDESISRVLSCRGGHAVAGFTHLHPNSTDEQEMHGDPVALASAMETLSLQEELQRALLCENHAASRRTLDACISDGLYFFAENERLRRTYLHVQRDVNSRAPQYAPKKDEWDYHKYFLTRSEYDRKNPYRADRPVPGLETSTVENPAQEYRERFLQRDATIAATVSSSLLCNPLMRQRQALRQVQLDEQRIRVLIAVLRDDFIAICGKRTARWMHDGRNNLWSGDAA